MDKLLLTPVEAARVLGIGSSTVYAPRRVAMDLLGHSRYQFTMNTCRHVGPARTAWRRSP